MVILYIATLTLIFCICFIIFKRHDNHIQKKDRTIENMKDSLKFKEKIIFQLEHELNLEKHDKFHYQFYMPKELIPIHKSRAMYLDNGTIDYCLTKMNESDSNIYPTLIEYINKSEYPTILGYILSQNWIKNGKTIKNETNSIYNTRNIKN